MSLKIIGAGKGIPEKRVVNSELAGFLDTGDDWIVSRTGIHGRYVCTTETLTDLSAAAARRAIENSKLTPGDMDMVICSTIGGDFRTPSLACCVSERIGAKCPAFDLNAACTGFIYALDVASCFLSAGKAENILIVCAEMMSKHLDWNDRNTSVLFGDGAAACVVTNGNALKYIEITASANSGIMYIPSIAGNSPFYSREKDSEYLRMQGQEVFKFAVTAADAGIKQALTRLGVTADRIDWFILHQANKRIIDSIRTKLRQPEEKFPVNIQRYGNISSVSIPLLLHDMLEDNRIKAGDTIFFSAFGGGLTVGSCVMVWE